MESTNKSTLPILDSRLDHQRSMAHGPRLNSPTTRRATIGHWLPWQDQTETDLETTIEDLAFSLALVQAPYPNVTFGSQRNHVRGKVSMNIALSVRVLHGF